MVMKPLRAKNQKKSADLDEHIFAHISHYFSLFFEIDVAFHFSTLRN